MRSSNVSAAHMAVLGIAVKHISIRYSSAVSDALLIPKQRVLPTRSPFALVVVKGQAR